LVIEVVCGCSSADAGSGAVADARSSADGIAANAALPDWIEVQREKSAFWYVEVGGGLFLDELSEMIDPAVQ
jgi:hypothetical protein